jgi:hypothetical protein
VISRNLLLSFGPLAIGSTRFFCVTTEDVEGRAVAIGVVEATGAVLGGVDCIDEGAGLFVKTMDVETGTVGQPVTAKYKKPVIEPKKKRRNMSGYPPFIGGAIENIDG